MTPWQQFYASVRDITWPDCDAESGFHDLPLQIQLELQDQHGYSPGQYALQPRLVQRKFPIKTATACQLKWNWSTVYLSTGHTASCHRTNHHSFDTEIFDFHNTPEKLQDRQRMLQGEWPERGCGYCQDIENAGGQSDRITNLDHPGIHPPMELDLDPYAVKVTPRILEVYFDNVCNLKCVYCGPHFSSLWDAENKKHKLFQQNGLIISDQFQKDPNLENNKQKIFAWLRENAHNLTNFNILGGEPLFQPEFDQCLQLFQNFPAPDLTLQIFTNLNVSLSRLRDAAERIQDLIQRGHIRGFFVTASLDCWGPRQEYARFPLNLNAWSINFDYLLSQPWIQLVIGSTITPLTVTELPELIQRIRGWNLQRPVSHYFNSVNHPSYMFVDIMGDLFSKDFERALALMPNDTPDQTNVRNYLAGIAQQSSSKAPNQQEILKLRTFLDELDRRRHTSWRRTFPELVATLEHAG